MIHPGSYISKWTSRASLALVGGALAAFAAATLAIFIAQQHTAPEPDVLLLSGAIVDTPATATTSHTSRSPSSAPWILRPLTPEQRQIPPGARVEPSGLTSVIIHDGDEALAPPTPGATVSVRMLGWRMEDGTQLEGMTTLPVTPTTFTLDEVIPGFAQGLELMRPGERRRLWIPAHLAYHDKPNGPQGTLIFDIELVAVSQ